MAREPLFRRYLRFWGVDPRQDADDELAFHIAMREAELRRAGMTESDAAAATSKRLGDLDQVREELRRLGKRRVARSRRAEWLDSVRQDLRYAIRSIAGNPMFAAMVVLTMAIGIGANTAVFSVAYGVLLRPLQYRDADALVRLWSSNPRRGLEFFSVSPADYLEWTANNPLLSATAAFERQHDATLVRGSGDPEAVGVASVTPSVFPLLGTAPLRGRSLSPEDARTGAPVAVVSHELWSTRFGSDPALLGGRVSIDGSPVTVVGVMPQRFAIPGTTAQIWTPLSLAGASSDHSNRYLRVLARLSPGVTLARARARMEVVAARLGAAYPSTNQSWSVNMVRIPELIVGTQFRRSVLALIAVVGFVLLIACANAANLQLARAAARQREIALRAALGATRGRVARQLLTESGLLGLIAGVAGLALAYLGIQLLRLVGGETVPRLDEVKIDGPVLAFAAAVALGSGILFGLLPALRASRRDPAEVLKAGSRGTGVGAGGEATRSVLVVAQVSLSLVLLIGAGLLLRSFMRLQSVEVGFETHGLAVVPMRLPDSWYPDLGRAAEVYDGMIERVRHLPGVTAAAAVSSAPFAGPNTGMTFVPAERTLGPNEPPPDADSRMITPGYLRTLGIRLVRGRDFSIQDRAGAPAVVLVSESLVQRYLPEGDPIGRRLRVNDVVNGSVVTVVGVVRDARYQSLETPEVRPMIYLSALANPSRSLAIVARGAGGATLSRAVRGIVGSIDSRLPPPPVSDMEELVAAASSTRRFALVLFGVFAGVALTLAALGVYGVMSYLVRQRAHEAGIRIALGASSGALVRAIVGRALLLTGIGIGIGLVVAGALTRSLSALLFEVRATDPLTFIAIAILLAVVAAIASLAPAMRATRADPLEVLRRDA